MRVNVGSLRPVAACLLAGLLVVGAAQPATAAPRRAEQWYLDELRIEQVHKISTGRGVVVAVLDSGVEATHPDLRGQVLPGGRSYGASGDGRADEDGHGTHMAGIIAAKASGDGVDGIAPGAKILPIKLRKGSGTTSDAAMALGIRMAVDGGAKVINISQSGPGLVTDAEASAIKYAFDRDVVVVSGAGNTARGSVAVGNPANTPGVIAVTGTTRGGAFWSGSVRGPEAVVAAPGESVYNITNEAGYGWGDGTSDSSAIVSGLAALIRSKYPDLNAPSVINRIIRTARDAGPSGRDPQYGFGLIDPMKALTANVPPVTANPLLGPAAAPVDPGPTRAAGPDEEFDVTQHGDRGGPTDQQVMVVGVGIAVVLVLLLGLAVFLIWNRRRYRREAARAAAIPDEALDQALSGAYPSPGAGYAPPPGYPPAPGYAPSSGYAASPPGQGPPSVYGPPSGYAPPPGHAPAPGYGPPGGVPPAPPQER
ncbi:type VII secretion-associated serine protease mycosin [Micromonospora ureilytica]|uniref:Type VII secretion-associated serine protease mycosin n=1 Tax=Micromonospora ureilytica TaxID=709868 RepID=A0A3N9XZH5_9ACTN|nr:type VII secretion-associated serine protease mycosin [Micromonospora ureilytica]RQX18508.1 type VII secretion-associated serine protease mycosin [Micromonospora ureilytica]